MLCSFFGLHPNTSRYAPLSKPQPFFVLHQTKFPAEYYKVFVFLPTTTDFPVPIETLAILIPSNQHPMWTQVCEAKKTGLPLLFKVCQINPCSENKFLNKRLTFVLGFDNGKQLLCGRFLYYAVVSVSWSSFFWTHWGKFDPFLFSSFEFFRSLLPSPDTRFTFCRLKPFWTHLKISI